MDEGQMIKLRAYGGKELLRRVIRVNKDILIVCSPEEYEAALLEKREPLCVGFHLRDVIADTKVG